MTNLSNRVWNMEESVTLAASARAKALKAQGRDILSLTLGEPDFVTPKNIQDAAVEAIQNGKASFYTVASGLPELKDAINNYMENFYGYSVNRNQVVVATGAKYILYTFFTTVLNPGDEVIIPTPCWVSYVDQVKMVDGVPVTVATTEANNFKATVEQLEAARTDKTKVLLLNSPSNPTGMIYSRDELEVIGNWAVEHNILILADDIYGRLVYNGNEFTPISTISEAIRNQTVVVNGTSKTYAMTGWRIGFIAGPEWLVKACNKLQGQYTSGPCSVSQKAAEAAYTGTQAPVEEMRKAFERRRDLIVKLAKEVPGFEVNVPQGAFYLFPKCDSFFGKSAGDRKIEDSDDLAMYLLEVAHVACVGGASFGAPECIRMSYATSDENIVESIRRIKEALAELK